jgi:small GTP-binding protein
MENQGLWATMEMETPESAINVFITGEDATGKTSLVKSFVEQEFSEDYRPTVGVNVFVKKIEIDGDEVAVACWDFSGHERANVERWNQILPQYEEGPAGALIVGDLARAWTFSRIAEFWAPDVKEQWGDTIPIILVANKSDLPREVSAEDLEECKNEAGAVAVLETSAKDYDNVGDAFAALARIILEQ